MCHFTCKTSSSPPRCRHTHRSPLSQALLTTYFLMWSKDSLPWKRLPLQGQGPSLFPVGLTPLCPRRHQGGTSLLVLPPGLDLFKCSSVCRACRQSTPSVTPQDSLGTSVWVTLTLSRAGIPQQHTMRHFFLARAGSPMFSCDSRS